MIKYILNFFSGSKIKSYFFRTNTDTILRIDDENSLLYGPYFKGLATIVGDVAQTPINLYYRDAKKGKQKVTDHPLANLFKRNVNKFMTVYSFFETMQFHALHYGNGVAQIVKNRNNEVIGLSVIMPWSLAYAIENNELTYQVDLGDGKKLVLNPEDVIHIRGFTFDGIVGIPMYKVASLSIKLGLSSEQFSSAFFENAATPSGILKVPYTLENEESIRRLKMQWRTEYQGTKNAANVAVLEEGADFKPISQSFQESQMIESRQFQKLEMANWFNIPNSKLGDKGTYASTEESNRDYLATCLNRWFVKWEQELNYKLLPDTDDYFFEFNRNSFLRTTLIDRYNAYMRAIMYGIMSPNEVRQLENLPEYPSGDKYYAPVNIWPTDEERPVTKQRQMNEGYSTGGKSDDLDKEGP